MDYKILRIQRNGRKKQFVVEDTDGSQLAVMADEAQVPPQQLCSHMTSSCITADGKQITEKGTIVRPSHWGIRKSQIRGFLQWCRRHSSWTDAMSVRDMVKDILAPEYQKRHLSVAVNFNRVERLSIMHLISHSWDENTLEFLQDVLSSCVGESAGLFICFFSVYQGTVKEINVQVTGGSNDIREGCFATVLSHVKRDGGKMIVVPNDTLKENGQGLYSRLWCSWELYNANTTEIPLEFHPPQKVTEAHLLGATSIENFSTRKGHCGPPADWDNVDEAQIISAVGDAWEAMDRDVKDAIRWIMTHPTGRWLHDGDHSVDSAVEEVPPYPFQV
eukprot:TRINITY_DN31134_c0_g1_i1.p1 TRINITY_DN31134_c0_g1~~TRINITY_DN31134_c0_g1_i1.p1  ORF type:complete len:362 (+),score=39.82 TRINITY_DN31134_c0_g1_i1:92-1087(+)